MLALQVSVKDSIDWSEETYQEFCAFHSESSQEYETLLSMCGIPRQLDHMLSQRHQLLSNLGTLASTLDVKVSVCPVIALAFTLSSEIKVNSS